MTNCLTDPLFNFDLNIYKFNPKHIYHASYIKNYTMHLILKTKEVTKKKKKKERKRVVAETLVG